MFKEDLGFNLTIPQAVNYIELHCAIFQEFACPNLHNGELLRNTSALFTVQEFLAILTIRPK